ncbi:ABC transporter permease [Bacillus atrophaeus]|uniref:ABC transporter permease n=1 Tax=Bacillus atrophaeus TaxID=1452 RepID=UPI00123C6B53|nr:ABC transporter permease [Bacillus atrophaeus]KAA6450013.1 MrsG [Bacillus atrophaeus]
MKKIIMAERLKLKRSSLMIVIVLVPLLILAYEIVNLTYRAEYVEKQAEMFHASSMWMFLLYDNSLLFGLGFPLSATLAASIIANIEHQANGWKQTLSLPISRVKIYLSKFTWLAVSLFLSSTIFLVGMVLLGSLLKFEGRVPWGLLLGDSYGMLITALPIMAFQIWLSMVFSNQAFSILIGSISAMMGLFLAASETTRWFPLAYPSQSSTIILQYEGVGYNPDLPAFLVISFLVGIVLLLIGSIHFAKRDVS